jgi:hypothetical protein
MKTLIKDDLRSAIRYNLPVLKLWPRKIDDTIDDVKQLVQETKEVIVELNQEIKADKVQQNQPRSESQPPQDGDDERVEMDAFYSPQATHTTSCVQKINF